jgi:hypothetical protein
MLREKALKAFGKPNLGSRRIFHNELFIIAQSDKERLEHKILPWEDTFPLSICICKIIHVL